MEFRDKYAFLSNMYSCPIHYKGETFPCIETAFQWEKCADVNEQEKFINNKGYFVNGFVARKLGRQVKLRDDWKYARLTVMYDLLEEKFCRNEKLRQALKDTGNIWIQEDNDWGDTFWGVCNGVGENMLGKMIMEIRQNIQDCDRDVKKVIVAGSRNFKDYKLLCKRLDYYFSNIQPIIICGEARGADTLGRKYAEEHNYLIESYPADWSKGRDAGYIRNKRMAEVADCAICFWNGKSKGTEHMIDTMKKLNKPVKVVKFVD